MSLFRIYDCDVHESFAVYHGPTLDSRGRYDTVSHMVNCKNRDTVGARSLLTEAITEAGFGKQGADWQTNDVSRMSHYTPPPHTHTHRVLHLLQGKYRTCDVLFFSSAIIQMSSLHSLDN